MTYFCLCERSEAISREGEVLQSIYFITLVVGYFAYAQYDVKNEWAISLALNTTCFFMRIISFSHPILLKIHKIKVKTALSAKKF